MVDSGCCADDLVLLGGPDLSIGVGGGHGVADEHGQIARWVVGDDLNAADLRRRRIELDLKVRRLLAQQHKALRADICLRKLQAVVQQGLLEVDRPGLLDGQPAC